MRSLTLKSPAKLNLFLRVGKKKQDGYHELVTLFHRISLADTLRLECAAAPGIRLSCNVKRLAGPDNLIVKAYGLLKQEYPDLGGVRVHLDKKIPVGAGLGGGSSNAASFLIGMKKLCRLGLSHQKLVSIGKKLGADVPFFLYGVKQAVGRGRGDRIFKAPAASRLWFTLIASSKGLSTKSIYQKLAQNRAQAPSLTKADRTVKLLCNFLRDKDLRHIAPLLLNDLEAPAFRLRPGLKKVIASIGKLGAGSARMSGSGPTIFTLFSHPQDAKILAKKMRKMLPSKHIVVCHSF